MSSQPQPDWNPRSEAVQAFEPDCRSIAVELGTRLQRGGEVELMVEFAQDFALRIQCAFLGWPSDLREPLRRWTRRNRDATLTREPVATAAVALEFDGYVRRLLDARRKIGGRRLDEGARISLVWASANRDDTVFGDPDEFQFRLDRDPTLNLLYGAGIHGCPGRPWPVWSCAS